MSDMSGSNPHIRKCTWDCQLSGMDEARSLGIVGYLVEESKVYCACLERPVRMGSACAVFPSADFDLNEVMERYEHARK